MTAKKMEKGEKLIFMVLAQRDLQWSNAILLGIVHANLVLKDDPKSDFPDLARVA